MRARSRARVAAARATTTTAAAVTPVTAMTSAAAADPTGIARVAGIGGSGAALAWEVVLVDRALLDHAKQALCASSTSEAIDRALLLVAQLEQHDGRQRPARSLPSCPGHDDAGGYRVQ